MDNKSGHVNPEKINSYVPDFLHKYAGQRFNNESHIHIYVETYNLAWAMPLKDYINIDEDIIEINSNENFIKAIKFFKKLINLQSNLKIQNSIIL